jgi:hypothetical protein
MGRVNPYMLKALQRHYDTSVGHRGTLAEAQEAVDQLNEMISHGKIPTPKQIDFLVKSYANTVLSEVIQRLGGQGRDLFSFNEAAEPKPIPDADKSTDRIVRPK